MYSSHKILWTIFFLSQYPFLKKFQIFLTKLIVNLIMIVKGGQNQTIKDQNEKTQKISGGFKFFLRN